jgi:hypothetical protein
VTRALLVGLALSLNACVDGAPEQDGEEILTCVHETHGAECDRKIVDNRPPSPVVWCCE